MGEDHAEFLGVVERVGMLRIPILVWTFAFGFASGERRTLVSCRRSYNSTADETPSPGGFYRRLAPSLVAYSSLTNLIDEAQKIHERRPSSERHPVHNGE